MDTGGEVEVAGEVEEEEGIAEEEEATNGGAVGLGALRCGC